MRGFDPEEYGPVFAGFLRAARLAPLGPGKPDRSAHDRLAALDLNTAFAPHRIADEAMARCCLAGLWLYFDALDESHHLSQDIVTPSGSYWHGLMHRREPDFENSKYWFRRVGRHAVFPRLHAAARELAARAPSHPTCRFLVDQKQWDSFAFIDLCRSCVQGSAPCEALARSVQQREWELLFDYCYGQAVGAA